MIDYDVVFLPFDIAVQASSSLKITNSIAVTTEFLNVQNLFCNMQSLQVNSYCDQRMT